VSLRFICPLQGAAFDSGAIKSGRTFLRSCQYFFEKFLIFFVGYSLLSSIAVFDSGESRSEKLKKAQTNILKYLSVLQKSKILIKKEESWEGKLSFNSHLLGAA